MDMRLALSLLSAAVLLLAASCTDDAAVMSELDAAEFVMEDYPETALALLDTMQRSRLVSREAAARHALLYSQALDKNYVDMHRQHHPSCSGVLLPSRECGREAEGAVLSGMYLP